MPLRISPRWRKALSSTPVTCRMSWPRDVRKADLRIETYRGSGPGGQHRNKTESAVRITHVPSGISAQSEDERSQHHNRRTAFRRLSEKLIPLMKDAARSPSPEMAAERIRTYHQPRNTVKDHRVPGKVWSYSDVVEGRGLGDVIDELLERPEEQA